jgi:hypothetical protein
MAQIRCKQCGVKFGQHPRWLCRACDVAAGTYVPVAHVPRVCRRCGVQPVTRDSLCRACAVANEVEVDVEPAGSSDPAWAREVTIHGLVYIVVWDGSIPRGDGHRRDALAGQLASALDD